MSIRHHSGIAEVVRRDPRYAYEAYEFLFHALEHTQRMLGRKEEGKEEPPAHHVSGRQLLDGVRDLALREYGLMARAVLHSWGICRTDDFGDMVFNLVENQLMNKTDEDTRADFHNIFDLDDALLQQYEIKIEPLGQV